MACRIRHLPYCERLAELSIPSIKDKRKRWDMIRGYQIMHSHADLGPSIFFERDRSDRTRGHPLKLVEPTAVSRVRRNVFEV